MPLIMALHGERSSSQLLVPGIAGGHGQQSPGTIWNTRGARWWDWLSRAAGIKWRKIFVLDKHDCLVFISTGGWAGRLQGHHSPLNLPGHSQGYSQTDGRCAPYTRKEYSQQKYILTNQVWFLQTKQENGKKWKIVKMIYFFLGFGRNMIRNCTARPAQNNWHSE